LQTLKIAHQTNVAVYAALSQRRYWI